LGSKKLTPIYLLKFRSFWQAFGYMGGTNALEELLKKDNIKIEEILDEENILNDIKSGG